MLQSARVYCLPYCEAAHFGFKAYIELEKYYACHEAGERKEVRCRGTRPSHDYVCVFLPNVRAANAKIGGFDISASGNSRFEDIFWAE